MGNDRRLFITIYTASRRAKTGRGLQGTGESLLAVFRADLDAVGIDQFGVGDADEAEHPSQIGFEMLAERGGRAGAVEAAARNRNDDALVVGQTLGTLRAIFEGLARDHDA